MKTYLSRLLILSTFTIFLFGNLLMAQNLKENSVKITLSGTSTLHEWDMLSTKGTFTGVIKQNKITNVTFEVPIKSLVSGKSAMDRNAYAAMHADKYPDIVFMADEMTHLNGNEVVKGKLIINNVSKTVDLPLTIATEEDGYTIQGFTQINMTDFDVEPPLFMMGAVKTGELVSVRFIVSLVKD